jgi:hypothetical protein
VGAAGAGAAVDSSLGEVPSLAAGSVGIASGPASGGSGPMARKQLFEMLAGWCEEGISEGAPRRARMHAGRACLAAAP